MDKYTPKIGMEIHVQPKTKSKMFCSCVNEFETARPNKNICEICTGQPGTLPVINEKAVELTIKAGLALDCEITRKAHWDRKHYFYPDLPKGYQITQKETPLCVGGKLKFEYKDFQGELKEKEVLINRLHLEEDAGKDLHPKGAAYSLVDFNRAGAPLIELVTEPVIENKEQAVEFCKSLQRIFRYIRVSGADMEKGQMRCEVNISLGRNGKDGTKVEIKNINSFKGVARSIEYEIKRQSKILDEGEKIKQETRGWDAAKQATVSQRSKEEANDYRYFPEPDLPQVNISDETLEIIRGSIVELPVDKEKRFREQLKLAPEIAKLLASDIKAADYFDQAVSEIEEWEKSGKQKKDNKEKLVKLASNYLTTELIPRVVKNGLDFSKIKITPENFAELMVMIGGGEINSSAAQVVLGEMFETGGDPSQISDNKNLRLERDEGVLEKAVEKIIKENEKAVADWKSGKQQAFQFLIGKVMAETKGKAEPGAVIEIIKEKTGE
ncbi:MAG: Asp-tRNA(Asn)/Glu-tRNA(Gln) amidotransferase subunit GatB [Patescibacteria group bacterium]|nr:Asp-tRNA(Asn)/Glu-tRNA(Gln) amidotransferase subunit GatB [Patescibacteria group bacterium]